MKLIFIRHGEPDYSIDSLTEKGWREAELLGERAAKWDVTAFYRSPLGRAGDTAKPTLRRTGREAEILPWLEEFSGRIPDPEGEGMRRCWDLPPRLWAEDPDFFDPDRWDHSRVFAGGTVSEARRKTEEGLDGFLLEHGYRRQGRIYVPERANRDTYVFFCHLAVLCVSIAHLIGAAAPVIWQGVFLPASSVTVAVTEELAPGEVSFRLQTVGDAAHLLLAGEPVSYMGSYYPEGPFQG